MHFADCLHLPVGAFLVKVCLERPAGRDKHEIKNKISAENAQSKAEGIQIISYPLYLLCARPSLPSMMSLAAASRSG